MPFARFLVRAADEVVRRDVGLRVWVPHEKALEALDVLGHRYWRNSSAAAEIQRMGLICRALAREASFPGQQVVAVAADVLRAHLTTGQAPVEDGHLGALLAWVDPDCRDALREGRARARIPASGVLQNTPDRPDDDRVDRLRKMIKGMRGRVRAVNERRLRGLLEAAADREWQLLADARCAFLRLDLPAPGLDGLARSSNKRIKDALTKGFFPARRADLLAAQLEAMEAGRAAAHQVGLENDARLREAARQEGTAVGGDIVRVDQPKPGFKPCGITVDSSQGLVRLRRDDKVKIVGTNVAGVVRSLDVAPTGGTRVTIEVTSGVRSGVLTAGTRVEIIEVAFSDARGRVFYEVGQQRQPWVFFADTPPVLAPGRVPAASPLEIAASRRRRT
jgi:hypothetical protein